MEFTSSKELRRKLKRLEALMPGSDLAEVIEAAVTEKLERLEAKRFGKTSQPRKSAVEADTSGRGAGHLGSGQASRLGARRRTTHVRERRRRRCPERDRLEFHHVEPYGLGGDRSAENITLMCRVHNLYMAEQDYGKEKMIPYRRLLRARSRASTVVRRAVRAK